MKRAALLTRAVCHKKGEFVGDPKGAKSCSNMI